MPRHSRGLSGPEAGRSARRVRITRLAAIAAACIGGGCASAVGTLRRDAAPDRPIVLACALALALASLLAGRQAQRRSSASWVASSLRAIERLKTLRPYDLLAAAWVLVVLGAAGADLTFFLERSPNDPTLSRLIGDVTAAPAGRAILFAAWLAWGAWVAFGWRRSRS